MFFLVKPITKQNAAFGRKHRRKCRTRGCTSDGSNARRRDGLVLQSPANRGLISRQKSIARYPEMKSVRLANTS